MGTPSHALGHAAQHQPSKATATVGGKGQKLAWPVKRLLKDDLYRFALEDPSRNPDGKLQFATNVQSSDFSLRRQPASHRLKHLEA
jgi:hypothetical protein